MAERKFRYMREDFPALPVELEHCDIRINFVGGRVEVENTLRLKALVELSQVVLDARDVGGRKPGAIPDLALGQALVHANA